MFFRFSDDVPANTAFADRRKQYLKLTFGIIHRVEFSFPVGCAGLAHCRVLRGAHQLWPYNPEGSLASDGEPIEFNEFIEMENWPTTLIWETWNEDDTYDHTLLLRVGILPRFALMPAGAAEGIIESLKSLFTRRF